MNCKVSVIVPVYNAEEFLGKCVESILNQTYKNIEIILINDGSVDNSREICEKYLDLDSRVKVFNQANKGRSIARNIGIENADGEYYTFVDSDDWIDKNMIEELLKLATRNSADVVISTIKYESEFKSFVQNLPWEGDRIFKGDDIIDSLLPHLISSIDFKGNSIVPITGSVCRSLYSSNLIKKHKIVFDSRLRTGEDKGFNMKAFIKSNTIYTTNKCYYHYNRSTGFGGSTTQRYIEGMYQEACYRKVQYEEILRSENLLEKYKIPLDYLWLLDIVGVIRNYCFEGSPYSLLEKTKIVKKKLRHSNFSEIIDNLKKYRVEGIRKRKLCLLEKYSSIYVIITICQFKIKRILVSLITRTKKV